MDLQRRPPCSAFAASVGAGGVTFDPTKAQACLQAYDGLACPGAYGDGLPGCAAVAPKVALGSTCNPLVLFGECAGLAKCHSTPGRCGGTCTAYLAPGDYCPDEKSDLCPPGTYCLNSYCTAQSTPAGLDQPCDPMTAIPCQQGLYCAAVTAPDGGLQGTCRALKTTGSCVDVNACALPTVCRFASSSLQCVSLRPVGSSCTPGQFECQSRAWCGSDDKCTDVLLPIGADCSGRVPEQEWCVDGARCAGYVCTAYTKPGDPCASDDDCGPPAPGAPWALRIAVCDPLTNKCQSCQ